MGHHRYFYVQIIITTTGDGLVLINIIFRHLMHTIRRVILVAPITHVTN